MTILGALLFLIQLGFAIHVVKTGREVFWVYIIMFLPGIGIALYFFTQLLPDSRNDPNVRKASKKLLKAVDPQRDLRKRKDRLEIADTVENRLKLADEYIEAEQFGEAIPLLEKSLQTTHENDPYIMLKLAQAQFGLEQYQACINTLDKLIEENPNFQSHDGHLLYARSHEALGNTEKALEEYEALSTSFPGEEARYRYAQLLEENGKSDQAQTVYQQILTRSKQAPKYYQRKEKYWINQAKQKVRH